tara:strand:+ start:11742 stop:12371 length:630 start_codon:yes stop_codon:yes gene_type:complete
MINNFLIGVCGGSASGKTRFSLELKRNLNEEVTLVSQDNYYFDSSHLNKEEIARKNFDQPQAIDLNRLHIDLEKLKKNQTINLPIYCFNSHCRLKKTKKLFPARIIIVEGLFLFENEVIRNILDLKIFIDVDSDVRLMRRIERDIECRGRPLRSVIDQYSRDVRPMYKQYIEPKKKYADIVLEGESEEDLEKSIINVKDKIYTLIKDGK